MKTSTLVKIARSIEREHGITIPCTMDQMINQLETVAGCCRTKAAAEKKIGREIYQLNNRTPQPGSSILP